ncbi:MAG: hypothetical protein E7Z73_00820 [Methanobrevibacter millerae]|uniref:Uncharacterized protein n=1 Tax=Methanobrevibacter millerae TaxID=230361 RepID=A0A8T3VJE3_9EURY|nr:hypothetical protein [Methanobrevibacter millerae]MBE6504274.1 hypothetical protein [Methanobrevibacter millerae]
MVAGTYPINLSFAENTYYKSTTLNRSLVITKVTPTLNALTSYLIPVYEEMIVPFGVSRNTRIPLTGTVTLKDTTTNTTIDTVDVNAEQITAVFSELGEIPCKLTYSGNNYLNSVNITIIFTSYGPKYIITCNKQGDVDITLVDSFPSDTSV